MLYLFKTKQQEMPKNLHELFQFWDELRRRKVVKASLVYLAVAFAILQASDIIFPKLGLPEWTVTFVIILLVIVFILVVVLTWVYDITPEGIKVTKTDEEKEKEKQSAAALKTRHTGKSKGIVRDEKAETELRQKVISLEAQLEEAKKISYRRLLAAGVRTLIIPVIIIVSMLLIVFNKQRISRLFGSGGTAREAAMVHNARAKMYIEAGDYESARTEAEIALQNDPGYSYAWGNMAVISYRLGDREKAILQTTKAIELDKNNSYAPFNIALALHDKNEFEQAIRWYKAAIRIDSMSRRDSVYTAACSALGNLFNSINRPIEAAIVLQRAMKTFPESRYEYLVYRNLGNSYLLQTQADSALKYLELSNTLNPGQSETVLSLAKAYETKGDLIKSIETWKSYINLEQDSSISADARNHLKEITKEYLQELSK
jgi:tetratricopeptide (TPR) repeat protein